MDAHIQLDPREKALLDGLSEEEAGIFSQYLFSIPKNPSGKPHLKSRAIGLYDPFCDRRFHPMGIIWQCAPYSFCDHMCTYCYGRSYLRQFGGGARVKSGFLRDLDRDLAALESLKCSPRHISLANSTDVLQYALERKFRHTLYLLERLAKNRHLFSSACILTKAPAVLLDDGRYIEAISTLHLEVQISIAFWDDAQGRRLEPGAPPVSERRQAAVELVKKGVPVALRLDPLFPRGVPGCAEYQGLDTDIRPLIGWAVESGVSYVITSALKQPFMRNRVDWFYNSLLPVFSELKGCYRRMPKSLQEKLISDVQDVCQRHGIPMEHCFHNILKRRV
ncbi:MAG: hypothetical protein V1809_02160 [Planctomycetota bacterium]